MNAVSLRFLLLLAMGLYTFYTPSEGFSKDAFDLSGTVLGEGWSESDSNYKPEGSSQFSKGAFTGNICVKGATYTGNVSSAYFGGFSSDYVVLRNISNLIAFNPSVRFNDQNDSIESNFAKLLMPEESTDIVAYLMSEYNLKTHNIIMDEAKYTNLGRKYKKTPDLFKKYCGTDFVSSVIEIGRLVGVLRISYPSASSYNTKTIHPYGQMFRVFEDIKAERSKYDPATKITFGVYQLGGDQSRLPPIFGTNPTQTSVTCSVETIDKCYETALKFTKYMLD